MSERICKQVSWLKIIIPEAFPDHLQWHRLRNSLSQWRDRTGFSPVSLLILAELASFYIFHSQYITIRFWSQSPFFWFFSSNCVDIWDYLRYTKFRSVIKLRMTSKDGQLWRNWHTRMIQVHVSISSWGFKSLQLHWITQNQIFMVGILRYFVFAEAERKRFSARWSQPSCIS